MPASAEKCLFFFLPDSHLVQILYRCCHGFGHRIFYSKNRTCLFLIQMKQRPLGHPVHPLSQLLIGILKRKPYGLSAPVQK